MRRLHIDHFYRCFDELLEHESHRAIMDRTREATGKKLSNISDIANRKLAPSFLTWERMRESYPEYFPPPVYIDESGQTYAIAEATVKGNKVYINNVSVNGDNAQVGVQMNYNKK